MAVFRNYSSGLFKLKLLCVCMLIILCALLTCKIFSVICLSHVSAKDFISEQVCFTTYQFPYLIMHGTMEVSVEGINFFCTQLQLQLWCFNTGERQLRI